MTIREATEKDITAIVALLKLSLGESSMPKSEEYWRWKHIDNPFGPSPVLLAIENNEIVGVRAFMRWEWRKGDKIIKAVRAVDTATHPKFQGKGIFKKLTLQLVEQCKTEGVDLIFNTPNPASRSGYLKMGWKEAGALVVGVSIKRPLSIIKAFFFKNKNNEFLKCDTHSLILPKNIDSLNDNNWRTNYSSEYLTWRFVKIPSIAYYSINENETTLIFRLIKNSKGVELRVTDIAGPNINIKSLLNKLNKSSQFDFISIAGEFTHLLPGLLKINTGLGPKVTLRSLNYSCDDFFKFTSWSPSLGDMEVF